MAARYTRSVANPSATTTASADKGRARTLPVAPLVLIPVEVLPPTILDPDGQDPAVPVDFCDATSKTSDAPRHDPCKSARYQWNSLLLHEEMGGLHSQSRRRQKDTGKIQ